LEDVDFAFRAQLAGARAVFVPSARVYHRLTATAGGTLSSYYVGRNTVWTIAKNMPSSLLWPNFGTICAAQLRVAADALRNIRGVEARARLRGQLIGVATLGRLLPKRWIIQSRCRVDPCDLSKRLYG
jgi:GT2 family glycosyltransferase